eukprot:6343413-Amphidinium_carterae.1
MGGVKGLRVRGPGGSMCIPRSCVGSVVTEGQLTLIHGLVPNPPELSLYQHRQCSGQPTEALSISQGDQRQTRWVHTTGWHGSSGWRLYAQSAPTKPGKLQLGVALQSILAIP